MPDGTITQTFLTLFAAVAVLGAILLLIKKYGNKINNNSNLLELKILAKMPLPPKSNIYIIKAANKTLLIGTSDKNISTLAELDSDNPQSVKKEIAKRKPEIEADNLSFTNFLKSTLKKSN